MSNTFTEEELAQIKLDAEKLRSQLEVKKPESSMEELKAQLKKEMEEEFNRREQERLSLEAKAKEEAIRNSQAEQLQLLQAKIDSLTEKRGVANVNNPFKPANDQFDINKALNDPDFIRKVDDASRELWFKERVK